MRADYLSYQRATSVAVFGIISHVVLGAGLLVYGILNGDPAARTASVFVLLGVVVWTSLAVLFDQHRRERIEAIEAENFAEQDLASSSVFEESGDELRVAAKRLQTLYAFAMPTVSVLVGAALVVFGILLLPGAESGFVEETNAAAQTSPREFGGSHGWGIAVGIGLAVIGFVFARFTSGMARAEVWSALRGGSVYAVGASLLGLALAVCHFLDLAGLAEPLRLLDSAFAIAMIVLGAEVFLNFVLDIYRPRAPGTYPRPAFDSRLLGFAAAPDRIAESISDAINYQFGFEVTSSWFYRLLSKSFIWLILIGGAATWLMTSLAVVEPHQRGVLVVNGEVTDRELGPGLHVKPPWPFGRVVVPDYVREVTEGDGTDASTTRFVEETATGVRTLELSAQPADADGPILWGDEELDETWVLVQPATDTDAARSNAQFGRGLSLASVRVPLYYSVARGGVKPFLLLGRDAEARDSILRSVAQRELVRELGSRPINEVIGPGREAIRRSLQSRIERAYAELNPQPSGEPLGAGVDVLFVGFEDARPPREAAAAFEQVFEATQKAARGRALADQHRLTTLAASIGSSSNAELVTEALDRYDALGLGAGNEDERRRVEVEIRDLFERSGGAAADEILLAQGERWRTLNNAHAAASAYRGRLEAYRAAPEIVETRLRLDAIAQAIEDLRLYVVDEALEKRIRVDLQDVYLGTDVFDPEVEGL
ncbi:MAG: SPFH domain-containing protein [Planctomycetota bacterium]